MTLQVTGKNLDIGEALRSYVVDRIEQTLEKYVGPSLSGHIRIEKERGQFRTDCSILLRTGLSLHSHGESQDAYAAVDLAVERLDKRLRRYKRRLKKHHGPAAEPAATLAQPAIESVIEARPEEGDGAAEADNPVIIAETEMTIRQLSVSNAVMEMDLSDRPFLVFRNAGHGRINIVYRRPDGHIGWIDPGGVSRPA